MSFVEVRDLWVHTDLAAEQTTTFQAQVPGHGLAVLKLYDPSTSGLKNDTKRSAQGTVLNGRALSIDAHGSHTLRLTDVNGTAVYSRSGAGASIYNLHQELKAGVYLLELTTQNGRVIKKVVLQ